MYEEQTELDQGEVGFCHSFLEAYPMVWYNGWFYDENGRIHDLSALRARIARMLTGRVRKHVARRVDALLDLMAMLCRVDQLPWSEARIHLANGTYILGQGFTPQRDICTCRLPVAWNPEAPEPVRWKAFLEELLEEEDILTLQEYLGYCLLPVTLGQKMLLIVGQGGEGKSRIGVVVHALFGDAAVNGSLAKIESSPFARADLEGRLVMVDDDLRMESLSGTSYIKSIITAETNMDLERKNAQSHQGRLFARFLAFGNGSLQAIHDRSQGFFRRQIILTTKDRPADRVDDPYLGRYLVAEAHGILLWALEGLNRLFERDFQFTISPRAQENLRESAAQGNNIPEFMESEGYFRRDPGGMITSRDFYRLYRYWCEDNQLEPLNSRIFSSYLCQNLKRYGLERSNHVPMGMGRLVRGYRGAVVRGDYLM